MKKYKHLHIDAQFELTEILLNGSWKGIITDNTAPSAKLRKPKNAIIQKAFQDQWKSVTTN